MKKFLILFMMLLPIVVTSCKDDKDEPGGKLSGTWVKDNLKDQDSTGTLTFQFKGTSVTYTEKWSEPGYDDDIEVYAGTFVTTEEGGNSIVTMQVTYNWGSGSEDYTWSFIYSISGKELTLTPNDSNTRSDWGSSPITLKKK